MDTPFEFLPTISICTGTRGLDRGVERVIGKLRPIAYVEIEAFIIANLLAGMQTGAVATAPVWANLKSFPWSPFRGKVGLVVGGYPCQPFSNAGRRLGADDPRHLWPFIEKGIHTARPLLCFFENVSGHLSLGFEAVATSLQRMGYTVEAGLYTAAEVGAPHKRARLFILAVLDDARRSEWGTRVAEWVRCDKDCLLGSGTENPGRFARAGKEVANPDSNGPRANAGGTGKTSRPNEGQTHGQERNDSQRQRCRRDPRDGSTSGKHLADARSEGLQRGQQRGAPNEGDGTPKPFGSTTERSFSRWPARPGQQQYDWEAPRLVESPLGCTANGYNFREDFLRALGNGVVEQTAELAFRDLLKKHFG